MCRIVYALSLFTAACSDGGHDGEEPVNCAEEDRDDDFVVGISKQGAMGKVTFTLLEATPAPPSRGDNLWVLQLTTQGAAAPITGAAMVVRPFMPDHQHGAQVDTVVEPMPEAGKYKLNPVNLWMPGLWETTISVQNGQDKDTAIFRFCIPS